VSSQLSQAERACLNHCTCYASQVPLFTNYDHTSVQWL